MEIRILILKTSNFLINFYQNTIQTNLNSDITEIPTVSSVSFDSHQNSTEEEQLSDHNIAIISCSDVEPGSSLSLVGSSPSDNKFLFGKRCQGLMRNCVSQVHNCLCDSWLCVRNSVYYFLNCFCEKKWVGLTILVVYCILLALLIYYILPRIALKHEDNEDGI
ncbi:hypothetical protein CDIK_3464 [Cucumispora dikerogammari]|nr:hypothetical protein CDIK_3464 [Cucumispora dikerogammari]